MTLQGLQQSFPIHKLHVSSKVKELQLFGAKDFKEAMPPSSATAFDTYVVDAECRGSAIVKKVGFKSKAKCQTSVKGAMWLKALIMKQLSAMRIQDICVLLSLRRVTLRERRVW